MNFEPLLNLLEKYEKHIVKVVLVNFAPTYLVLYLFFCEFRYIDVIPSIIIAFGVSLLLSLFIYFLVSIVYHEYFSGMTMAFSSVFCAFSIILGYISGFNISTLVIGICSLVASLIIIAMINRRKNNDTEHDNVDQCG